MRTSQLGAIVAAVMLAAADPALAQVPGGSYLDSCANVHGFGDRLIADCRRADGSWRRAVLPDVGSCVGDISNQNGHLRCDRGGPAYGGPPYGGYGYQPYAPPEPPPEAAPGYGYPYGYR